MKNEMTVVRSEKVNMLKKAVILVLLPSRRTLMLVDNLCINTHELLCIYILQPTCSLSALE